MPGIKVYNNFISDHEADMFVSAMDNNMDSFYYHLEGKERSYYLGQDNFEEASTYTQPNTKIFPEIEGLVKDYAKRIEAIARKDSGLDVDLSVLWFIKTQGIKFPAHTDNDAATIYRYNHTCMLYLNDCHNSGQLHFPTENFTYSPRKGDLVSFDPELIHEVWQMDEIRYTMPSWFTTDKRYSLFQEK